MQSKSSFMPTKCRICGRADVAEWALSSIGLKLGYGSSYDGESVTLCICGKCADRLYRFIQERMEVK